MKCVEAQGLITKYINGELSGEKLEDFLAHIYTCDDCKEEFEIYYVIMKGMKQIDDDNVINYNFHEAFEDELERTKNQLVSSNKKFIIKMFLLEIIIIIISLLLTTDNINLKERSTDLDSFNGDVIEQER